MTTAHPYLLPAIPYLRLRFTVQAGRRTWPERIDCGGKVGACSVRLVEDRDDRSGNGSLLQPALQLLRIRLGQDGAARKA